MNSARSSATSTLSSSCSSVADGNVASSEDAWDAQSIFGYDPLMSMAQPQYLEVPLEKIPCADLDDKGEKVPELVGVGAVQNKAKRGSCSECRQRRIKCCRSRPCLNCISRNLTCSDSDDEQQMVQVKAAKPCNPVAFVACLQITAERVDQTLACRGRRLGDLDADRVDQPACARRAHIHVGVRERASERALESVSVGRETEGASLHALESDHERRAKTRVHPDSVAAPGRGV